MLQGNKIKTNARIVEHIIIKTHIKKLRNVTNKSQQLKIIKIHFQGDKPKD